MELGIQGRVALIGASGRGLGLATAQRLAMEGCHIAVCDKDEAVLDAAQQSVQAAGGSNVESRVYQVDLTQPEDIEQLVASVKQDLGAISILVTNSGGPPPGPFDAADDEKWLFAYQLTFLRERDGLNAR